MAPSRNRDRLIEHNEGRGWRISSVIGCPESVARHQRICTEEDDEQDQQTVAGRRPIGRNEGERLKACLRSLVGVCSRVVYVDSGSHDDSVSSRGVSAFWWSNWIRPNRLQQHGPGMRASTSW